MMDSKRRKLSSKTKKETDVFPSQLLITASALETAVLGSESQGALRGSFLELWNYHKAEGGAGSTGLGYHARGAGRQL